MELMASTRPGDSANGDDFVFPFLNLFKNKESIKLYFKDLVNTKEFKILPAFDSQNQSSALGPERTVNCCQLDLDALEQTGWVNALDTKANPSWVPSTLLSFQLTETQDQVFTELLRFAKAKGVKVDLVVIPTFLEYGDDNAKLKHTSAHNKLVSYLREKQALFEVGEVVDGWELDHALTTNNDFYLDNAHFNGVGANYFSSLLFKRLGI